ncbi:hypothetical protein HYT84_01835 [Candidatus Micrarchaeota archaeon]|nr:hypothetical protein [Candidatus Micrarchaeota archaeon]
MQFKRLFGFCSKPPTHKDLRSELRRFKHLLDQSHKSGPLSPVALSADARCAARDLTKKIETTEIGERMLLHHNLLSNAGSPIALTGLITIPSVLIGAVIGLITEINTAPLFGALAGVFVGLIGAFFLTRRRLEKFVEDLKHFSDVLRPPEY